LYLDRKRKRQDQRFNSAVEVAAQKLVGDPTSIGSKFNSSGKAKRQKRSNIAQPSIRGQEDFGELEKARKEAEIQKILAETEQIRLQNELKALEVERQKRSLNL
jgi:hypothetical protein